MKAELFFAEDLVDTAPMKDLAPDVPLHYPTPVARRADLIVHVVGLVLAITGGSVLLALAVGRGPAPCAAIAIYAAGFVLMLAFSLAYNFSGERRRPILRRLDHAGIFLMIAGSYTPFTTLALKGGWSVGMTTTIWVIAGLGILGKLFTPNLRESLWITIYLAMGWIVVIAAGPIVEALPRPALALLVAGGLLYSLGVVFHIKENLQFSRSIWHGHVVAGASVHWAAILIGTVLPVMSG